MVKKENVGAGPVSAQRMNKSNANTVGAAWYAAQGSHTMRPLQINKQSAITLIALVITIIIMLILAGVVLNLTIGEHGIFKTAQDAAKSYTNAEERERAELNKLNANLKDEETPEIRKVEIDEELARLLREAKMTLTLEDIQNTPGIMEHVNGLIPTVKGTDLIRSEESGIVTYRDEKTGGIIRTNSEFGTNWETWKAFDGITDPKQLAGLSKSGDAADWYLEYEFNQKVYATQIQYVFHNGTAVYEGTRVFVIQGYNEETGIWEDVSGDIMWTGTENNTKEESERLNYTKAYKKYKLQVKSATHASDSRGSQYSGITEMQLYGEFASKIASNTDENLKQALLANSDLEKITLSHMTTNKEFMKRLLDALSMQTVENNQTLMDNLYALIPTLTQNDVTKVEGSDVITYNDTRTGGAIRTNSEYASDSNAWKAFDGDKSSCAYSLLYNAENWYLEYEFAQKVYVTRIEYMLTNGSSYEGTKTFVIQGYNEETSQWEDISEELTWTGKHSTAKEEIKNLNYEKAYKRYRLYVKTATASNSYGRDLSGLLEMQLYGKKQ